MEGITLIVGIFIFLLGICIGSFCNVCILRIPEGQSVVTNPSHCMTCGKRLKWYEMVPVFSWLALRGRCSGCHTRISAQYPIIEALNGALWVLVYGRLGFSYDTVLGCLFVSVLLVLSVIDARTREIPPGTTIFIAVLGVARLLLNLSEWKSALLGLICISGVLLLVLLISGGRGVGGGDVKLMAGTGLFLGFKLNLLGFFLGCIVGAVIHLCRMKFAHAGRDLAFGPYLSAGSFIAFLWGDALINWYLALL